MKALKYLNFLTCFVLLAACSPEDKTLNGNYVLSANSEVSEENNNGDSELEPVNYMAWVENSENGLKVEKSINDFTYTLQYKPLEYVALLDLKKDHIGKSELENKVNEFSDLQYFTFQISTESQQELLKKNVNGAEDYSYRVNYFSFEMQNDLKLIDGKDTLDCELFHFERVFGVTPYAKFVLGFPAKKGINDKTLFYDEKIFGSGKIYLTIQAKNNNQLPAVITY